jgi:hypothetical protein
MGADADDGHHWSTVRAANLIWMLGRPSDATAILDELAAVEFTASASVRTEIAWNATSLNRSPSYADEVFSESRSGQRARGARKRAVLQG